MAILKIKDAINGFKKVLYDVKQNDRSVVNDGVAEIVTEYNGAKAIRVGDDGIVHLDPNVDTYLIGIHKDYAEIDKEVDHYIYNLLFSFSINDIPTIIPNYDTIDTTSMLEASYNRNTHNFDKDVEEIFNENTKQNGILLTFIISEDEQEEQWIQDTQGDIPSYRYWYEYKVEPLHTGGIDIQRKLIKKIIVPLIYDENNDQFYGYYEYNFEYEYDTYILDRSWSCSFTIGRKQEAEPRWFFKYPEFVKGDKEKVLENHDRYYRITFDGSKLSNNDCLNFKLIIYNSLFVDSSQLNYYPYFTQSENILIAPDADDFFVYNENNFILPNQTLRIFNFSTFVDENLQWYYTKYLTRPRVYILDDNYAAEHCWYSLEDMYWLSEEDEEKEEELWS